MFRALPARALLPPAARGETGFFAKTRRGDDGVPCVRRGAV